jgi:enamine deaminase RidA (YjgF/YER057c/UK114 family)
MSLIRARLNSLGIELPPRLQVPSGMVLPFSMIRIVGKRAFVSGHGPQGPDGRVVGPFGKVGGPVSEAQAIEAARLTGLSMIASLERTLGDLDRIAAWCRVFGMVQSAPGFHRQPAVINGFSDLILQVFGPEVGAHARSAVGMAELPFNIPVEIEAEIELNN